MRCILGGTFTCIHAGHARLLAQCRKFGRVTIGLTSDSYVKRHKLYPSLPFAERKAALAKWLADNRMGKRAEIMMIEDGTGIADSADADAIIVSEETENAAMRINAVRKSRGRRALRIISVPLVYGEDLKKISCRDIFDGKSGKDGKLHSPLLIQVGTENPAKLKGAKAALSSVFKVKIRIHGHKEDSKVAAHPFGDETFRGAKMRAHAAWKRSGGKCDYSLGIESGLFRMRRDMHLDITVCCAYDGKDETYGTGMGFAVPEEIVSKIKKGKSDLSRVMAEMTGIQKIGRKHGAIGHFSSGVLKRHEQIGQSVACAFVPRIYRASGKLAREK